jgi:divalent metal cation (Fe/Co/Zn/Cd) transporter
MESQWHLFRAKAFADGAVFIALLLSLGFRSYAWSVYVDPIASFVIAGFLLYSVYGIVSDSVYDLLDKTLDESLQIVINRELAAFYDKYTAFHGVRSRRSGSNIYIEIFLEFDGDQKMSEVQQAINDIKTSLERKIKGSRVIVAPTEPIATSTIQPRF